jgi:hypothetical protein
MRYRSLAILITALSSTQVQAADIYVAPGGVYVGAGPVYVTPSPAAPVAPYAPSPYAQPGYVAPTYVAPGAAVAPAYDVPPPVYREAAPVYVAPYGGYGWRRPAYVARPYAYGYPDDYAAALDVAPRPPAIVPERNGWCAYNGRWEYCR